MFYMESYLVKTQRGHQLASQLSVQKTWEAPPSWGDRSSAPGSCADCAGDAYIRMSEGDEPEEMLCAHCYGERARADKDEPAAGPAHRLPRIRPQ